MVASPCGEGLETQGQTLSQFQADRWKNTQASSQATLAGAGASTNNSPRTGCPLIFHLNTGPSTPPSWGHSMGLDLQGIAWLLEKRTTPHRVTGQVKFPWG